MPKYKEERKKLLEADNFLMDDMRKQLNEIGISEEMLRQKDIQKIIDRVLRLTAKIICEHNRKNVQVIRKELSDMPAESEYVPSTAQSLQEQARIILRFVLQGILQMQKVLQEKPISAPESGKIDKTSLIPQKTALPPATPKLEVINGGES